MKKTLLAIAATIALSTAVQAAEWETKTEIDDFDGIKTVSHFKFDDGGIFSIRERNNKTELFFGGKDAHICGDQRGQVALLYKFDDSQIYYTRADLSTNKKFLFLDLGKDESRKWLSPTPEQPDLTMDEFIAKAKGSKTMTIRYHDKCGTQLTYKF